MADIKQELDKIKARISKPDFLANKGLSNEVGIHVFKYSTGSPRVTAGLHGEQGTPFRELEQVLPSYSRSQLQVLIRELKQDKLIYMIGKTSAARWFAH